MFSKRNIFVFIILSVFLQLTLSAADIGKAKIAILPFSARGNIDKATLDVILENFTIAIVEAGVYSVVMKSQLDKALSDLKFKSGDVFDESLAADLGKMVGAQIVVFGNVNDSNDTYYVNVRGIDVAAGTVTFLKREEVINKGDLIRIINKMAKAISSDSNKNSDSFNPRSSSNNNTKNNNTKKFNREDLDFIEKYYNDRWDISTDDRYENRRKLYQFIAGGSVLVGIGGPFFLSGIVILAYMVYTGTKIATIEKYGYNNYGAYTETNQSVLNLYYGVGFGVGLTFMLIGAAMVSLCSIPFWFASRVQEIYRKDTGKRLSLLERTKFDARIVATRNSLTNEYNRKISFDLSISL